MRRTPNYIKAFSYYFDESTDMLWFNYDLYKPVDPAEIAVSVSLDIDANQATGIPWYGTNKKFQFDKMLSVGVLARHGEESVGYNGITDEKGVKERNWINVKRCLMLVCAIFLAAVVTCDFKLSIQTLGVKHTDL